MPGTRPKPVVHALTALAYLVLCLHASTQTPSDEALIRSKAFDALRLRDYTAAESLFRQALTLNPKSAETYDGLSLTLSELNRLQAAVEAANRAIALNDEAALPHYHLGLIHEKRAAPRKALSEFEEAIELDTNLWQARYEVSQICTSIGDLDGAVKMLRQVVHKKPDFGEARLNLALSWMQLNQNTADAIRELRVAAQIDSDNAKVHLALGELFAGRNEFDVAVRELQKSISIDPQDAEGHYNLGLAWRLSGDLERSEVELRRALELKPQHALAHKSLGLVLREQNNLQGAREQLLLSVQFDPNDADAQHLLGSVLLKMNLPQDAVEHLRDAVRLNPTLAETYSQLAAALSKLGRSAEAEAASLQAKSSRQLKANANTSAMLALKADGLLKEGRKDEAIASLRQAIKTSPDFVEAHLQLAKLIAEKPVDYNEAERLLKHVLDLAPSRGDAYLALGILLAQSNRQVQALKFLHESLQRAPSLAEAHVQLGKLLLQQKRAKDAATELGSALAWDPDNHDVRVLLGKALVNSGQWKKAVRELQIAIRGKPDAEADRYLGLALRAVGAPSASP